MDAWLGIDTSCYTTSLCVVDSNFRIVADERRILTVKPGSHGLSQSNMVYQHTRNLPALFEAVGSLWQDYTIRGIAVTDKPRRRDDSYMPAFLAGLGYGRSLAALLGGPLYCISHQENHVLAILRCLGTMAREPLYAIHLSGGTTDLLYAVPDAQGLTITRIGGTSDISAGQFVDRVGVALGLPFPAGKHLDALAQQGNQQLKGDKVFAKDGEISFSGVESKAQRLIAKGDTLSREDRALWTLKTVWNGLETLLNTALAQGMTHLVAAGGVMSNSYLRAQIAAYGAAHHVRIDTGDAAYSADNASGAAFWAAWQERNNP